MKCKSLLKMVSDFRNLSKVFWGIYTESRVYFVENSVNVMEEVFFYIEL